MPPTKPTPLSDPPLAKAHPLSDEGVLFEYIDSQTIVNFSTDVLDAKRRELHVKGRGFSHVATDRYGHWIYRHD